MVYFHFQFYEIGLTGYSDDNNILMIVAIMRVLTHAKYL